MIYIPFVGENLGKLQNLGSGQTLYPREYSPCVLEAIPNQNPHAHCWASFLCPEFTALCPITGQPDFAQITINLVAHRSLVESKSLKLYLFSFRNHGSFHEDCIHTIGQDLNTLLAPRYLEVVGQFHPRGGIALYPFVQHHDDSPQYKALAQRRFEDYAPAKYARA